MRHDFIDKYSNRDSMIHRLDPRTKLVLCFSWLVLITTTDNLGWFALYVGLVSVLVGISRVPLLFYLKKLLMVTPLVLVLSFFVYLSYFIEERMTISLDVWFQYHPVLDTLVVMAAKIYLSILLITILISCTRFNDLLWGMRKFHLPAIVTTLSKLVYTYLFVFIDELHRTMRAYKSRTPELRISRVKVYGSMAASILLSSLERSDYIYKAMLSRGFSGEFPEGNYHYFKWPDLWACLLTTSLAVSARLAWYI